MILWRGQRLDSTWVTAEIVTASMMNTHVRDNMLQTAPAKVTTASQILVSTAANTIEARSFGANEIGGAESTTSTSYTNLATTGPALTMTTGVFAWASIAARMSNDVAGTSNLISIAVTGASAISASDNQSLEYESSVAFDALRASYSYLVTGLTAGSNTFTLKYRVSAANSGTFSLRRLSIIPL